MTSGARKPRGTRGHVLGVWRAKGLARRVVALLCLLALTLSAFLAPPAPDSVAQVTIKTDEKKSNFKKTDSSSLIGPTPKLDRTKPMYIETEELIYDQKNNRVIARGDVRIYYNEYILTSDEAIYDQNANTLTAFGNAKLRQPEGAIIVGDRLTLTDDFRDGFIEALKVVGRDGSRISAERAVRRSGSVTEYDRGTFTPCKACKDNPDAPPLWQIKAKKIIHDQEKGSITYQDAQLEFMGVPAIWLPFLSHPDPSAKRRSGFLLPDTGSSSTLGFTWEQSYYFALAPNYDFLFHPMYTTKQGILWQGDWRHRLKWGEYSVKVAAVDQNDTEETTGGNRGVLSNNWRGSVQTKGRFSLGSWWQFGWDVTVESDDGFRRFYKLDNILQTDRVNTVYLRGISERNYFSFTGYHLGGLLLEDTPRAESLVHPVIDYNYVLNRPVLGGELSFNGLAVSISRSDGTDLTHAATQFNWRRKVIDPLGQVFTPFAYGRGDVYQVSNFVDPDTLQPISKETTTRATGAVGVTYEYPFVAHTSWATHILQPTAQVIARPNHIGDRRLPNEDAQSLIFDDTLLFDVDKFSGWDRFETGTRINVGMQYTFQAYNGGYAKAVVGQSIHVAGDNPFLDPGRDMTGRYTFSPVSGLETTRSDYVAGLYIAPFENFRFIAQSRFDETDLTLRRQDLFAHLRLGPVLAQAAYVYTRESPAIGLFSSQQDVLAGLTINLTDRWSITGLMHFDIDARERIRDSIQLKYADDCFVLTATYTETFIENPALDIHPDRTFMLRFELKHLGQFKYKTDQLDHLFAENQPPKT